MITKLAEFGTRQRVFTSLEKKKRRAKKKKQWSHSLFQTIRNRTFRESQEFWWVALRSRFEVKNDHLPVFRDLNWVKIRDYSYLQAWICRPTPEAPKPPVFASGTQFFKYMTI